MKRIICIIVSVLVLSSCKSSAVTESRGSTAAGRVMFEYSDGLVIPPVPAGQVIEVKGFEADFSKLEELTDLVFGSGAYRGKGYDQTCTEQNDIYASWYTYDGEHNITLNKNGTFYYTNGDIYDGVADDESVISGETVYADSFETTELDTPSGTYYLSELSQAAGAQIYDMLELIGSDIGITPVSARILTLGDSGKKGADFTFAADTGFGRLRSVRTDGDDETAPCPAFEATVLDIDKIPSVTCSGGGLYRDLTACGDADILSCEDALKSASGELYSSASHITLKHISLEYTPREKNGDTYRFYPYWAAYAATDKGEDILICIDAATGQTLVQNINT